MFKPRHLLYIAFISFLVWMVYLMFKPDPCKSKQFLKKLCDLYEGNVITGTFCSHICRAKKWKFENCHISNNGNTGIWYVEKPFILKLGRQAVDLWHGRSASELFTSPKEGIDVRSFKKLIKDFLNSRIGSSENGDMLHRIISMADINSDGKINLAEARSIWALLQNNEIMLLLAFQRSQFVSQLHGFCGDLYAVDYIKKHSLPVLPPSGLNRYWSNLYGIAWQEKVKISVGLLEFTLEAYQHGNGEPFYMCDLSEDIIGYSKHFETRITNLDFVLPKKMLQRYLKRYFCDSDADCVYTSQCRTTCDKKPRRCTGNLVRPNLVYVCQVVERYVLPDVPDDKVKKEIQGMLQKCKALNIYARDMQLQHSLLLNDLRTVLWKLISSR